MLLFSESKYSVICNVMSSYCWDESDVKTIDLLIDDENRELGGEREMRTRVFLRTCHTIGWLISERMPRCQVDSPELGLACWLHTRAASVTTANTAAWMALSVRSHHIILEHGVITNSGILPSLHRDWDIYLRRIPLSNLTISRIVLRLRYSVAW